MHAILLQARIPATGAGIFALVLVIALFVVYLWSIVWAYGDAERRGKSGCLVALLVVLVSWPIGLLLWAVFRPEGPGRRR